MDDDETGTDQFCAGCQRRFRRLLDDVLLDFSALKAYMPKPVVRRQVVQQQASGGKSFGHPAEWASVTAQEIAQTLRQQHAALAEENRDHFPGTTALSSYMRQVHAAPPARTADEVVIVRAAHKYLTDYFDVLCTFDGAPDIAQELHDLHRQVRNGLGHSQPRERLDAPCPHCRMLTLVRYPGAAGAPIECQNCGRQVRTDDYGQLVTVAAAVASDAIADAIDASIYAYDRPARMERIRALCTPAAVPALRALPAAASCSSGPAAAART